MTVTNMKPLEALHILLAAEDPASSGLDKRASTLANKVATASSVLTSVPSLHCLALEVISNAFLFQCSFVDLTSVQPPPEGSLATSLEEIWTLLDSLLAYSPQGWSGRLFKWCVTLVGRVSANSPGPSGLEDALRTWITHPLLSPVVSLLDKCTSHFVASGCGLECMETLFPVCCQHIPNLNWLLAHVVSLHPLHLTSLLLDHTLSSIPVSDSATFSTLIKSFEHISRTHRSALRHCVVEKVRTLMAEGEVGDLMEKGERFVKLFALLRVAAHCPSLLDVVAEEVLKIVTADKIKKLVINEKPSTPITKSHDNVSMSNNDKDEGEILSDEEEMEVEGGNQKDKGHKLGISVEEKVVPLLSDLICQLPGKEACTTIIMILDVYIGTKEFLKTQEESIEEGEIVRESLVHHVIRGSQRVMCEVLSRLHSAACIPHLVPGGMAGGKGGVAFGGKDLDFAVGMQEGVETWCRRLLDLLKEDKGDEICVGWLQEILTCVCISCPELKAAHAIAYLLCHAYSPAQLSVVICMFKEIQARHFRLAHSTVQCVFTLIQQQCSTLSSMATTPAPVIPSNQDLASGTTGSSYLLNFTSNMKRILKGEDAVRSQFHCSLYEQLLPLTQLLVLALPAATTSTELIMTFDLMQSVLELDLPRDDRGKIGEGVCLTPQSRNRMLHALLTHHFFLMRMLADITIQTGHTHLALETALGKSLWLISWCTSTPPPLAGTLSNSTATNKQVSNKKSELASNSGENMEPASAGAGNSDLASASARVMAYSIIIETALSKDMRAYFAPNDPSPFTSSSNSHPLHSSPISSSSSSSSPRPPGELLAVNMHMGLSRSSRPKTQSGHLQQSQKKTANKDKLQKEEPSVISLSCVHLTSHLIRLLLAVGSPSHSVSSSAQRRGELATVLLDTVAPQTMEEMKQWPDDDTLKYSLERDLAIKRVFDKNPVLWQCLFLVASHSDNEPSGLVTCAPIVRSLLTVLTQHWQRCCVDIIDLFPRELENSVSLMECIAKAHWVNPPLSCVGELFPQLTPHEISLLLAAVNTFIKQNFNAIKSGNTSELKDTGYHQLIKGVLLKNIQHFGHLYARLMSPQNTQNEL